MQTRGFSLRSTTEGCQEGIAKLAAGEAKLPEILGIATCLVVCHQHPRAAPSLLSADTRECVAVQLGCRSPLLLAQAIPLLKNVILGKKWIMGTALEKHGEFSKQKKSCYFWKCLQLVIMACFNPLSPSCLSTALPGVPSASTVGALRRKGVFCYRIPV